MRQEADRVAAKVGGPRRRGEQPCGGPLLAEVPGRALEGVEGAEPGLVEEVVLVLHLPQQAVVQDARRLCADNMIVGSLGGDSAHDMILFPPKSCEEACMPLLAALLGARA